MVTYVAVRRDHALNIRLNLIEVAALEKIVEKEGRNASETIRELIREGAVKRGIWDEIRREFGVDGIG